MNGITLKHNVGIYDVLSFYITPINRIPFCQDVIKDRWDSLKKIYFKI